MKADKKVRFVLSLSEQEANKLFNFVDRYLEDKEKQPSKEELKVLRSLYKNIGNHKF